MTLVSMFSSAWRMVRPLRIKARDSKRNEVLVPAIDKVSNAHIRDLCSRHINWRKWDGRRERLGRDRSAEGCGGCIKNHKGEGPHWRALAGVTATPFLRRDGSIACKSGYDDKTGMFLMDPIELPPDVPERPTKRDAKKALVLLEELLRIFPAWTSVINPRSNPDEQAKDRRRRSVSFSVALSEVLTPIARAAVAVAPMHVKRAPVAGTGKSFVSDVMSAIANGVKCPVHFRWQRRRRDGEAADLGTPRGRPDHQFRQCERRAIGRADLSGHHPGNRQPRRLQKSETLPSRTSSPSSPMATTSVLRMTFVRRTLWCVIDAWQDEKDVQSRTFASDPVKTVLADRGRATSRRA